MVRVVHLDIKPENILVSEEGVAKFGDFGVSKLVLSIDFQMKRAEGTKLFQAPETWVGPGFKPFPLDVWALGVTFYYLATGDYPFFSYDQSILKRLITTQEYLMLTRPEYPKHLDPGLDLLLKRCLDKNPNTRITIEQMVRDIWITSNGRKPIDDLNYEAIHVTDEEVKSALTEIKMQVNFFAISSLKGAVHRARQRLRDTKVTV